MAMISPSCCRISCVNRRVKLAAVGCVGMENGHALVLLITDRIVRHALGLVPVGQRCTEDIIAEPSKVRHGRAGRDQRNACPFGQFSHHREIFRQERTDDGEWTIVG